MTYENLFAAVLLSFVVERTLAVVFDISGMDERLKLSGNFVNKNAPSFAGASMKGILAAALAIVICISTGLNILNEILNDAQVPNTSLPPAVLGEVMTGIFIAGGSQASVKLFQDVLGFSKANRDVVKQARVEAEKARQEKAKRDQAAAALERTRFETGLKAAENEDRLASFRADTAIEVARIERKKEIEAASKRAGIVRDPLLLRSPADPYLRDVIDDWEEFVALRADLRAEAGSAAE